MKRVSGLLAVLFAATLLGAQAPKTPNTPKSKEVTVRSSVSEDALVALYQDLSENKKKANDTLQQARATLNAKNKPIQAQIDPLQKQLETNNDEAQRNFTTAVTPFNTNLARDQAQIEAIEKLVKKEQNLPDNVVFDLSTGEWIENPSTTTLPVGPPVAPVKK
jgi:hypothetical protein